MYMDEILLSLLFSRLNSPSSLSLSSYVSPLIILVALCWALQYVMSMSFVLGNPELDPARQVRPYQC